MGKRRDDLSGLREVLRRLVPADARCAVRLEDGRPTALVDEPPRFTLVVRSESELARLAMHPSMLAVGEAFIDGVFDIEGDMLAAIKIAYRVADRIPGGVMPSVQRLAAAVPNARTERAAIAAHYDLSNDFYALFLDRRMLYTCAYYPSAEATLEQAQDAKVDLVCRKLMLGEGERLLDVGCGWGGLVTWAAERYGAQVHGLTLSSAQASWALRRIECAGLAARARVERLDLYDMSADTPFDKIAAVGVIEHIGVANYPSYFARVRGLLRPGGLFLSHGITHQTTSPQTSGMAFLDRYVFPGGDLATMHHTVGAMRRAGFEILHVEALGRHYVRTLREWLARLVARRAAAVRLVGERTYRIYVAYFAAAAVAFDAGWVDVHQVLARSHSRDARTRRQREGKQVASVTPRQTSAKRSPSRA